MKFIKSGKINHNHSQNKQKLKKLIRTNQETLQHQKYTSKKETKYEIKKNNE